MTPSIKPTRRSMLLAGATSAAAVAIGTLCPRTTQAARAAETATPTTGAAAGSSANGWPTQVTFKSYIVEGAGLPLLLAPGPSAEVLLHVVRRINYEVDTLRPGDLQGASTDLTPVTPPQSNYLSGTAVGVRPGTYPLGQSGNLYPRELLVVRDILAECAGVVRWGGDLPQPLEGHFEIAVAPTDPRVAALAHIIGTTDTLDSQEGAGAIDASDPERKAKADSYARSIGR